MRTRQLLELGVPRHLVEMAREAVDAAAQAGVKKQQLKSQVAALLRDPKAYSDHPHFAPLASAIQSGQIAGTSAQSPQSRNRFGPAPFRQWGHDLDRASIDQMETACKLPIAVRGALMPDAHVGYGLPIGGVLATEDAVIPYAVGVDIACRVKMSVLDLPVTALENRRDTLERVLRNETRFGIGASFKRRRQHSVLDHDWSVSPVTRQNKDKAWAQLGTSGSGNHFVEYGEFTVTHHDLGLEPGRYLAILSHSGSRGTGASVCQHYSRIAQQQCRELDRQYRHLAWLGLDTSEGQEYWRAMELMGHYAAANHACIHRHMVQALGAQVLLDIENHHNFAWKETHGGKQVVVHRKGATPAGKGVLGIIPGTMASHAYVVRGLGNPESLQSAAHGAGRVMSRTAAKKTFNWAMANAVLKERGVELLSAGLDEVPMVYKDIDTVMAAQDDLVEPLASFMPRLVKMAPAGERPED